MSRAINPTDRFSETFKAAPVGGGVDVVPVLPVTPASDHALIPICQLGPCVRYHEIRTKFEAAEPEDGTPGTVYTHPTRTCYPAPGIEIDVTEHPVRNCNLWEPRIDVAESRLRYREAWLQSEGATKEWAEYVESWPKRMPDPE